MTFVNTFDFLHLSETYLNSKLLTDDKNSQITGYKTSITSITITIAKADHPTNVVKENVVEYVLMTKIHYL